MKNFIARVIKKRTTHDRFVYLKLSLLKPAQIEFKAGQYISFELSGEEKRSYSIASAPTNMSYIELAVDLTPGGVGSSFISSLTVGQEISFEGVLGEVTIERGQNDQQLLFVGSGVGISPLKSMLEDLLITRLDQRPITLIWGLQLGEDLGWADDFQKIAQERQNFELITGADREIVDNITKLARFDETWGAYVCGKPEMVAYTEKQLVNQGISRDSIYYDRY
jgi:CDP-4-dehydro-6-deoxyglucose reductase